MKPDNLLDIIIPLGLGLKGKNEALRRGVKLMMTALIVLVIVWSAVSATLDMCPEGVTGWYVWVMVAWRIFLHAFVYCLVVCVVMALEGTLKDVINGRKKPAAAVPASIAEDVEEENTFFSSDIDEEALTAYIKSNPDKFTSSQNVAIFFLIMSERNYIGTSRQKFHEYFSSLIECGSCRTLSRRIRRVKEVLDYHDMDETRQKLIAQYEEMEKILQRFRV